MANIYLNLGINVADLYKDVDKTQLAQIQDAAKDGFSTDELKTLEEDGIDVSLIKDNSVDQPVVEEKQTDSEELKAAKTRLKEINKNILDNTTELRQLETDIILLEDEVNEEFENLVDKQQNLEEKQKDEIKEAQAKLQDKYTSSEGKMSEEDYSNSLEEEMGEIDSKYGTKFSSIAKDFAINNKKAAQLNDMVKKQGDLNTETDDLKTQADELSAKIKEMQAQHDAQLAAQEEAQTHKRRQSPEVPDPETLTEELTSDNPEAQAFYDLRKRKETSAGIQAYVEKVEQGMKKNIEDSIAISDTSVVGQMRKDAANKK